MTTLEEHVHEIQAELDLALSNPLLDALAGEEAWSYKTIQTLLDEIRLLLADQRKTVAYWRGALETERAISKGNLRLAAERATEIAELRKQIKEMRDETQKVETA